VPVNGWAVIRFVADNPGKKYKHSAFIVQWCRTLASIELQSKLNVSNMFYFFA
jgi:hypothetical protein